MKSLPITIICLLALAGCSVEPAPPAGTQSTHKTMTAAQLQALQSQQTMGSFTGYGATRFGMDEVAFRSAWPSDLNGSTDPAGDCSLLQPIWYKQLADFDFMFEHGHFVRYDVGTPKEVAPGGGRVGMSVAQIRTLYGPSLQVSPSSHMQNEQLLRIADGKGHVLVFETNTAGKVSQWRVGILPQIDYKDGCII